VSADLDRDIGAMVNLDIQSSEGDLVVETRVTERLAMLGLEIDGSFTPLRPVNQQGYATLSAMAETGRRRCKKMSRRSTACWARRQSEATRPAVMASRSSVHGRRELRRRLATARLPARAAGSGR
jgi:hypothetical protein